MTFSQETSQTPHFSHPPFSILNDRLQRGLAKIGFETPTPIQEQVIEAGLAGRDLLACAQTGSGKTAAFLLPILHRLLEQQERDRLEHGRLRRCTRVLILAPTRELAAQIKDHFTELAVFTNLRGAAVFGGVAMGPQEEAFRSGVDLMVATPGRLLDHFSRDYARLDNLEYLILDEADRMLDMGFLPDIRRVLAHLPKTPRQTMMFSATLPEPILKLSEDLLDNPYAVNIERPPMVAGGIEHVSYPVPDVLKQHLLLELLRAETIQSAIVFTRTKHRANRLAEFLAEASITCDTMHANRRQAQRTKALKDFRSGSIRILVATDIAARGIDVEALSHVINFDVPHLPDDYIHRSGRTARANLTGIACTLVSPTEMHDFRRIENHIGRKIERVILEGFDYAARSGEALEIPLSVRLAAHRAKRKGERERAATKTKIREERGLPATAKQPAAAGSSSDRDRNRGGAARPQHSSGSAPAPRRSVSGDTRRTATSEPRRSSGTAATPAGKVGFVSLASHPSRTETRPQPRTRRDTRGKEHSQGNE